MSQERIDFIGERFPCAIILFFFAVDRRKMRAETQKQAKKKSISLVNGFHAE